MGASERAAAEGLPEVQVALLGHATDPTEEGQAVSLTVGHKREADGACECGAEPPDGVFGYERLEWYVDHRRRVSQLTRQVVERDNSRLVVQQIKRPDWRAIADELAEVLELTLPDAHQLRPQLEKRVAVALCRYEEAVNDAR